MKTVPVLGELEAEVMNIAWSATSAVSVWDVTAKLSRDRAYNTVQTTLERLYRKSLLRREKLSHAFVYSPNLDRADYNRRLIATLVGEFPPGGRESVLAAFVDMAADEDLESLQRLEALIRARRESERGRG